MKDETIFRAVGAVGDDLIERAGRPPQKQTMRWRPLLTLAACCVLIIGAAALVLPQMQLRSTANEAAPQAAMVTGEAEEDARGYDDGPLVGAAAPAEEARSAGAYDTAAPELTVQEPESSDETAAAKAEDTAPAGDWILFDGQYYVLAPNNDGAHLAGDSELGDGEARGDVLGSVADSADAENAGCTVYAYPADGYVLVERDGSYQLYKLAGMDEK